MVKEREMDRRTWTFAILKLCTVAVWTAVTGVYIHVITHAHIYMRQVRCQSACVSVCLSVRPAVTNISMDQWQATNDRAHQTLLPDPFAFSAPARSLIRVGDFNWLNPTHPISNQNLLIVSNCVQTPEAQTRVLTHDTTSEIWHSLSHIKSWEQSLGRRINSSTFLRPSDTANLQWFATC